jgi:hypothetical protein
MLSLSPCNSAMALSKDILATLAYYDVLDTPLTSFEVWKYLISADPGEQRPVPVSLGEIVYALEEPDLSSRIGSCEGFYFLPGREALVDQRIRGEKSSSRKMKRVRRLAALLRLVPFVRMIGITGSLPMMQGDPDSDWDFFVITRASRIWTGRTILTGILHVFRKRRHGEYRRDRACLNYFITEDRLEIPTEDLFSANEYTRIIPLFGRETFRRFELRNRWIADLRPNFRPTELLPSWSVPDSRRPRSFRDLLEQTFDADRIESWLAGWQRPKIMRNPKTALPGSRIEASDHALIFLPDPHGPLVYERFRKRFGELRLG